ncbi:hypothetical protein E0500_023475 [Streptomyces sp. KM273126]|uniref:hypothetical protein n=1 Tax=Streptomyces sp. KM273126 TaxID=2545247 RepID=UPI00103D2CD0|nr:hypothetical protein [Streptomyces sp. KM273126]MBA2810270.1 hypothetical protein [Streptomyces sp. KM273126]
MKSRVSVAALTVPFQLLLSVALAGCSGGGAVDVGGPARPAESKAGEGTRGAEESEQTAPVKPRTAEEFLVAAKEAMAGEKGWTFNVRGSEKLVLQGEENAAVYKATVRRAMGEPRALHSTGTIYAKGTGKPEEIFVVGDTGYVKQGGSGAAWKHGSLTDPEIANKVEDPIAALDAFEGYARDGGAGGGISLIKTAGQVELQVRVSSAKLPAVRELGVLKKARRELNPTLEKLRAAGVTAPESRIAVERVMESVVLDASTYRIKAHIFRFAFSIPYGRQSIRYSYDVTESNEGTFEGTITLPAGVK